MFNRYLIVGLQFTAYLSLIFMVMYANAIEVAVMLVMYFFFGCIGMIMTYHRLLSHRSFKPPVWFEYLGTIFATLSLTGSAITWVAMHRAHHKFSDTEKDPHSPYHMGWWRVQFLTGFAEVKGRYAIDLMKKPFYQKQHKYYFLINLAYALVLLAIDPFAIVYAYLAPAALTLLCGTLVLSTAHRNKKPINSTFLSLLTWGDGYHAVHHDNSQVNRLGKYDLTGILIEKFFIKGK